MADNNGATVRRILKPVAKPEGKEQKKRVAAYCRVSTKSEGQETSYDTQVAVYTQRINIEPAWEMAGIYADWGMSGTQAQRRPKFLKMISDCEDGKIDIILCKSMSRFSRNTLDSVQYIRKMKDLGVRMIFEKEGIDTDNEISEMLITVLAAFAQEESHSHSENVKWGKRKRLQDGNGVIAPTYGYRKNDAGDNYEIEPEEAEVVRRIFDMYEKGVTVPKIVDALLKDGVKPPLYSRSGTEKWDENRIHYMIQNEKYLGILTCQRFYTVNHLTHRGLRNNGVLPSKQLKNHREAIIGQKQFDRCNEILRLRKKNNHCFYPFGDFLKCPYCGTVLYQRRLGIQEASHSSLVCEGDGACREFAILAPPVRKAVLEAWNTLDVDTVRRITGQKLKNRAEEAKKLLAAKAEHPTFETIEYFDEETGLFSVTACDENDKQALRWCVAKPDKRTSRRMRCPDFTDYLFDLMGWDKKCRYKVLGYLIPFEGKDYFVFDLKVKKTFNEKPKKGEEPLDENGEPIAVDTRTGYFSGDIANTFGVPMEQHKKETEITEMDGFVNVAMFTGVREKKEKEDHSQTSAQESPPEE